MLLSEAMRKTHYQIKGNYPPEVKWSATCSPLPQPITLSPSSSCPLLTSSPSFPLLPFPSMPQFPSPTFSIPIPDPSLCVCVWCRPSLSPPCFSPFPFPFLHLPLFLLLSSLYSSVLSSPSPPFSPSCYSFPFPTLSISLPLSPLSSISTRALHPLPLLFFSFFVFSFPSPPFLFFQIPSPLTYFYSSSFLLFFLCFHFFDFSVSLLSNSFPLHHYFSSLFPLSSSSFAFFHFIPFLLLPLLCYRHEVKCGSV